MDERLGVAIGALREIMRKDGPGADMSPAGPCYEIARDALRRIRAATDMSVEEAAQNLDMTLSLRGRPPWIVTVGYRKNGHGQSIVVYVKKKPMEVPEMVKDGWLGYPVVIKKMGKLIPSQGYPARRGASSSGRCR